LAGTYTKARPARHVLVLASSSAYRRSLLDRLHIPYEAVSPDIDESSRIGESPRETALRLAQAKARAVAAVRSNDLIIGSDQVATLDDVAIGKPGGASAALAQLVSMRGRLVVFHTAVCLFDAVSSRLQVEEVPTAVQFRLFGEAEAARYLAIDEPYDCAGSAKIESLGIALVERVESTDPTALIGLPLIALVSMLKAQGLQVP
jgi:septum formation protein